MAKQIFIISTGRTGGRTLKNVFSTFKDAVVIHEMPPLLLQTTYLKYKKVLDYETKCRELKFKWGIVDDLSNKWAKTYIELNPCLWNLVPELSNMFLNSKFLYITRDGRDYVRSGLGRGWYSQKREGNFWEEYRITPNDMYYKDWDEWSQFKKITWFWKEVNAQILKGLKSVPTTRKLQIKIEDINMETLPNIFKWMDIPFNKTEVEEAFNTKLGVSRKFNILHWKKWSNKRRKEFNSLAGDMLKELKYKW